MGLGIKDNLLSYKMQHHLNMTFTSWHLTREPMDRDRDCTFSSIAFGMLQLARSNNTHVLDTLQPFMDNYIDIYQVVPKLRQALAAKWMGPNSAEYL